MSLRMAAARREWVAGAFWAGNAVAASAKAAVSMKARGVVMERKLARVRARE